eukprot:scaffold37572_cov50-Prasinocladus_malaysianus.AAC.1
MAQVAVPCGLLGATGPEFVRARQCGGPTRLPDQPFAGGRLRSHGRRPGLAHAAAAPPKSRPLRLLR